MVGGEKVKKIIAMLMAVIIALPFAFADVSIGQRATIYDEADAIVGDRGYVDVSESNSPPYVFVCATKEGKIKQYGINIKSSSQLGDAANAVRLLAQMDFSGFDRYGCLRMEV